MQDILSRAGCFVAAIIMGYVLKKIKALPDNSFQVLTKLVVMITAPCAIINSFLGTKFDFTMLFLIPMGLAFGGIYMFAAYLTHLRDNADWKAFAILNTSAFNIGSFILPFAQGFLGPVGVIPPACLTSATHASVSAVHMALLLW